MKQQNIKSDNLLDLLGDLDLSAPTTNLQTGLGGVGVPGLVPGGGGGLLDGFNPTSNINSSLNNVTQTNNINNAVWTVVAFDKDNVKVVFGVEKDIADPSTLNITLTATNTGPAAIHDFVFQAAVPKTFQLQLLSPSGSVLAPFGATNITQAIRVNNPQRQALRMRIRLNFVLNGSVLLSRPRSIISRPSAGSSFLTSSVSVLGFNTVRSSAP
jgi:AP-1 complex subunit gamma-1